MSKPHWVDALSTNDLPTDDVISVDAADRDLAVYNIGGNVYATDNICSHGQARLCDGFLDGYEIECPMHQGKFDVRDGKPTCEPVTKAIRSYPVRIEDHRVFIQID